VTRPDDSERDLFQPLRPARGTKLVLAAVLGPIAWVIAWMIVAVVVNRTNAIGIGILITVASFAIAVPVLRSLAWRRDREERRFADRA
jgi:Kef-type K+ transport system membrane component KefB